MAIPASAAPTKYYTPTITPTCVTPSSTTNLSLTLTNTMPPGGQSFASAQITIPQTVKGSSTVTPFTVPPLVAPPASGSNYSFTFLNPSTSRNWTAAELTGNIIQLASTASTDSIPPGGSITFTFPATAPATAGNYEWTTVVKQSNDFRGTNNDFTLTKGASMAVTKVGVCNNPPVANNDPTTGSYPVTEDHTLNVAAPGVLANDTDAEGNPLTATNASAPAHGTVTLIADGSFSYVPAANYNGPDSFTYQANQAIDGANSNVATVHITVNPDNDAPVAANDGTTLLPYASVTEDTTLNVAAPGVLANDSDIDSAALAATVVTTTSHGLLTLNTDGSFSYTPSLNYNGIDSFTYKANDGFLDSNEATAYITVGAANDAPVLDPAGSPYFTGITKSDTDPAGDSVSDLIARGGANYITDTDASAQQGIAITGVHGAGTWQFWIDGGSNWTDLTGASSNAALLLSSSASNKVRFLPNASGDFSTQPSINFLAWDMTTGTSGLTADVTTSGGTTAFSSASDTASIFVGSGIADCGQPLPSGPVGERGFNKDGSACPLVNYAFEPPTLNDSFQIASFTWDTAFQPTASFKYTLPWPEPLTVDPVTGLPAPRVQVAWNQDEWHYGVACVSTDLPARYGTLVGDIGSGDTTLTINDTINDATGLPTTTPFAIVIPSSEANTAPERLLVTGVAGNVLTVVRHDGGTLASNHAHGSPIMSTPLPIDPNAKLVDGSANPDQGKFVPVCIAGETWTPAGYDSAGHQLYTLETTVIDIGDAYVKLK